MRRIVIVLGAVLTLALGVVSVSFAQAGDPVLVPFDTSDDAGNCVNHPVIVDGDPLSGGAGCGSVELCFSQPQQIDRVRFLAASSSADTTITTYNTGVPLKEQVFLPMGSGQPQEWRDFPYPGEFDCLVFQFGPTGHPSHAPSALYEVEAYSNWHDPIPITANFNDTLRDARTFIMYDIVATSIYAILAIYVMSALVAWLRRSLMGDRRAPSLAKRSSGKALQKSKAPWWDMD